MDSRYIHLRCTAIQAATTSPISPKRASHRRTSSNKGRTYLEDSMLPMFMPMSSNVATMSSVPDAHQQSRPPVNPSRTPFVHFLLSLQRPDPVKPKPAGERASRAIKAFDRTSFCPWTNAHSRSPPSACQEGPFLALDCASLISERVSLPLLRRCSLISNR